MLSNIYIERERWRERKFILLGRSVPSFQFLCCTQSNRSRLTLKQLGRKDFSMEQLPINFYMLLWKQKNTISINQ